MKKAYILFLTSILLVSSSFVLIQVLQNKSFSKQVDTLKYIHLQAKIHMDKIVKYYNEHNKSLESFSLNDDRYILTINKQIQDTKQTTFVYLKAKKFQVRLVQILH